MVERYRICFKLSPFYVLRPKTVRFPNQKHTVLERRTYGFGTETVEVRLLETEYEPFNQTFVPILPDNIAGKNQEQFLKLMQINSVR